MRVAEESGHQREGVAGLSVFSTFLLVSFATCSRSSKSNFGN